MRPLALALLACAGIAAGTGKSLAASCPDATGGSSAAPIDVTYYITAAGCTVTDPGTGVIETAHIQDSNDGQAKVHFTTSGVSAIFPTTDVTTNPSENCGDGSDHYAGNDAYYTSGAEKVCFTRITLSSEVSFNFVHYRDVNNYASTVTNIFFNAPDTTRPSVTISGVPTFTNGSRPFTATFTFDEDITGFDLADISAALDHASATDFQTTIANREFTATITPDGGGDVVVGVNAIAAQDMVNNDNTAATPQTAWLDNIAPTVTSIVRQFPTTSPTDADSLTWRVTLSERVKNVDTADFTVSGTTATVSNVASSDGVNFDVTVSGGDLADLDAKVSLSFAGGQDIADGVGNALTETTPVGTNDNFFQVQNTSPPPTLVEVTGVATPTNDTTPEYVFSSDKAGTATFGGSCSATTAMAVEVGNNTATFAELGEGTYSDCTVTVTDASDNASSPLSVSSFTIDITAPTVTISGVPSVTDGSTPFTATFTFDEDALGFTLSDITAALTNATATNLQTVTAYRAYTATITPDGGGDVSVGVNADAAVDIADNGNIAAQAQIATLDNTGPTLAEVTGVKDPTNDTTPDYVFSSDEAGRATFGGSCSATAPIEVEAGNNTVTFAELGEGTYSDCTVTVTDSSDNESSPLSVSSFTIDTTGPTVSFVSVPVSHDGSTEFNITVKFSEKIVETWELYYSIALNGAQTDLLQHPDGINFTFNVKPDGAYDITALILSGAGHDAAGNPSTASEQAIIPYDSPDIEAPTVASITRQSPSFSPTDADELTWRVAFSEKVKNVDASDFTVSGTTAIVSSVDTTDGTHFDVKVSGGDLADLNGMVTLAFAGGQDITDGVGNALAETASTGTNDNYFQVLNDSTAPTMTSITRQAPAVSPTDADSLTWRVTFSEKVKNVDTSDFTVSGTTATATGVSSSDGINFDVTVSGGDLADLNGTVTLAFAGGQDITDGAGNALTEMSPSGTDERSYLVQNDSTAPTVEIQGAPSNFSNLTTFTVTFEWSEDVTGFTLGDITVGNGSASNFVAVDANTYTADITPTGAGNVTLDVAANVAQDLANNDNVAARQVTVGSTIVDDTKEAITSFMINRLGAIASIQPDLGGLFTGNFNSGGGDLGNLTVSATSSHLDLAFSTSLSRVEQAAQRNLETALAKRKAATDQKVLAIHRRIMGNPDTQNDERIVSAFTGQSQADEADGEEAGQRLALAYSDDGSNTEGADNVLARLQPSQARARGEDEGMSTSAYGATEGAMPANRFDVWTQIQGSTTRAGDSDSSLWVGYAGAHYFLTPNLIVGALVQFDWADERNSNANSSADGTGWMAGPYVAGRIPGSAFAYEARAAWGRSSNTVSPLGTYTDDFDTTRWMASGKIGGQFKLGTMTVAPSVRVSYFEETQESYTDTLSNVIPEQTVSLGEVRFGPEFSWDLAGADGSLVRPKFGVTGVWNFDVDAGNSSQGYLAGDDRLRARFDAGLTVANALGWTFLVEGFYDGIGVDDYRSVGGKARLVVPLY